MKRILILNGAARKNGNTAALVKAFINGANEAGNIVEEFYLQDMNIHGCIGCEQCSRLGANENPCSQKDDMGRIYKAFENADVVAFASPLYFWTITGTLKTVADRLYAELRSLGYGKFPRESVLLMTAGGNDYSQARNWYRTYERNLGWKNLGEVLGSNNVNEAYRLGQTIGK